MEDFKKIENQQYIAELFRSLARAKEHPVLLRRGQDQTMVNLYFGDRHGDKVFLKLLENSDSQFLSQVETEVSFVNKETLYLFNTTVLNNSGELYQIEKPKTIFTSFRRLIARYKIHEGDLALLYFSDHNQALKITDISTKGLSFRTETRSLSVGKILRNVRLELDNSMEINIDGSIVHCKTAGNDGFIYGLVFIDLDWPVYFELFSYLFKKKYPNLKSSADFPTAQIHKLYDESGYLNLKSKEEMTENFLKVIRNLERIQNKPQVFTSLVYHSEQKILTGASLLRVYNNTFLGQSLAAVPEARFNIRSKLDIYLGLIDFLLNHPYFKYYLTYFDAHLPWHLEMYQKIGNYINDNKQFILDTAEFIECNTRELAGGRMPVKFNCEPLDKPHEFIEYCQSTAPELETNVYGYNLNYFDLKEIRQTYELLDLYVKRRLWRLSYKNEVLAYAVAEAFTDGLNIFNLLDMCRITFVRKVDDKTGLIQDLLPELLLFFRRYKKEAFNILFKTPDQALEEIRIKGLTEPILAGRVMMNKAGLGEYRKLLLVSLKTEGS